MGKDKFSHKVGFSDNAKKKMDRVAALLNLEDWCCSIDYGMDLALQDAEAHVKGKTAVVFCTPELAISIKNHPAFFAVLCQEGVIEWLTPFVLGKPTTPPEEN
jgi:hypothetical protein